ncbi:MAG TPA: LCP family protein [Marmoricola sp.]|jgi:LCP family protein required for cell wall assembly|nr:LCP family protein [Marmoricola sp.]
MDATEAAPREPSEPAGSPDVQLIDDRDLSWVDKPQMSDEERERRHLRNEEIRKHVRRKRKVRTALKITAAGMAALLVLGVLWFAWTFGGLARMPAVAGQAGLYTPGTNILLVGANPDEPDATAINGSGWPHAFATSDMVMVLHLTKDKHSMFVISIPADSIVPIPGGGEGKLADAFRRGGAPLYVKTVETLTGIRMDHVMTLDMSGLREITNDVGGIVVNVPAPICDTQAGPTRLDGDQALDFMAFDADCPQIKDVERVQRQQTVLKALMAAAVDGGKLTNPFRVNKVLRATAGHLTVEHGFGYPSMVGLLFSMRHLRSSNTTFLTVPVAANAEYTVDGQDAVRLDASGDAALWNALRQDRLAAYVATNTGANVLR